MIDDKILAKILNAKVNRVKEEPPVLIYNNIINFEIELGKHSLFSLKIAKNKMIIAGIKNRFGFSTKDLYIAKSSIYYPEIYRLTKELFKNAIKI